MKDHITIRQYFYANIDNYAIEKKREREIILYLINDEKKESKNVCMID
jgi:hypothetical protein